ncbi:MAG: hypothetical protein GTN62_02500 [Gemmatimonadales bacterium]|nr:hypothetical protein [Gemmatimonadales bacterium]NIN10215.1 hypothetical protein [Gemmatimonadales bacterium]NIN48971.1 hypothetical protein [Gemmatimonadales bacterium]NIP06435.1 hypothetical protein [Gemmatimonadales bacterium]NIQ98787.1 hypothetical protein [Gemmatimonadales bacterium]
MFKRVRIPVWAVSLVCSLVASSSLYAQETPADTAAILMSVVRTLEAEGRTELAEELLQFIIERYPGTRAAEEAARRVAALRGVRQAGSGRVELIVWTTTYGVFLGLAIPAAFGADDPEPYGAGLLIGGPLGFLASSIYSRHNSMSSGQARVISFATQWGAWQGVGWQQVLEIGDREICDQFGCSTETSDEAPWTAAVVGSLAGLGAGVVLTRARDIPAGGAELARHAALWGAWYGLAAGVLADAEDDALLTAAPLGGDIALLGAIPAARAWHPTSGRVRLISIAGVAGAAAGLGLDLLLNVDDEKPAVLIPTATATVGLVAGALLTRNGKDERTDSEGRLSSSALLNFHDGVRLALPTPLPTAIPAMTAEGEFRWRPGIRLTLLDARF